jgi:glycosyl transferase family 25
MNLQAYVINLDRAPARMARMNALLNALQIPFDRVRAVDGAALSPQLINDVSRPVVGFPAPNSGQIGCFLSHKAAWERIAHGTDHFGLVLEDDVVFARNFQTIIRDPRITSGGSDVVRLEGWPEKVWLGRRGTRLGDGYALHKLTGRTFGTCGYLISRECAERLTRTVNYYRAPIDHMLFWRDSDMAIPLDARMLVPAACYQHLFYYGSAEGSNEYLGTSIAAAPRVKTRASGGEKMINEVRRLAKRVKNLSQGMVRKVAPLHPSGPFDLS